MELEIEFIDVDDQRIIIKLVGENIPIILMRTKYPSATCEFYYEGLNNGNLSVPRVMKEVFRNSPDYEWHACRYGNKVQIMSPKSPTVLEAVERHVIQLTPRLIEGEPFGFLPMKRNADGELVPVDPDENV